MYKWKCNQYSCNLASKGFVCTVYPVVGGYRWFIQVPGSSPFLLGEREFLREEAKRRVEETLDLVDEI